jgi:hypothetical protein
MYGDIIEANSHVEAELQSGGVPRQYGSSLVLPTALI